MTRLGFCVVIAGMSSPQHITKSALVFLLFSAFLNMMGIGLIIPVIPFLVQQYLGGQPAVAVAGIVGLLTSVYALCQFLAAPGLGMLSDRFGRRPILLVSLLGSAVGYVLFGIGGALWVLFLSRVIDGLTGGNISTMFAYVADTTPPAERSKYYGMLGASIGFGFVIGPALGGLLSHISLSAPFFIAAAVMFVNGVWGYFVLPESVTAEHRLEKFELSHLNPFEQLWAVLKQPVLRRLMLVGFLYFLPFAALQGNGSVLMKDVLGLTASGIGGVFFVIGVVDIGVQGFLMRKLLDTVNEIRLIEAGMLLMAVGFLALASLTWFPHLWILLVGVALFALGGGLFEPSFSGLISHAADPRSQGRVQGANQSLQSLTRVIGPLAAAALYQYGAHVPYVLCMVFALAAFVYVVATRKQIVTAKPVTE